MTDVPIAYASISPVESDSSNIRILSILHYVWGGMSMLFSCFFIIYIVMGIAFLSGKFPNSMTVVQPGQPPVQTAPPDFMGWVFIVMGSVMLLLGWTSGILTILSGRWMMKRRRRIFSLVVGGINCAIFPLGTTLGVFTFIVLLKDSVRAQYEPMVTSLQIQ